MPTCTDNQWDTVSAQWCMKNTWISLPYEITVSCAWIRRTEACIVCSNTTGMCSISNCLMVCKRPKPIARCIFYLLLMWSQYFTYCPKIPVEKIGCLVGVQSSSLHIPYLPFQLSIFFNQFVTTSWKELTVINVWPLEPHQWEFQRTNSHLVWEGRVAVCGSIANSLTACQVKTAQPFYTDHQAMSQTHACDALTPVHLLHSSFPH